MGSTGDCRWRWINAHRALAEVCQRRGITAQHPSLRRGGTTLWAPGVRVADGPRVTEPALWDDAAGGSRPAAGAGGGHGPAPGAAAGSRAAGKPPAPKRCYHKGLSVIRTAGPCDLFGIRFRSVLESSACRLPTMFKPRELPLREISTP